MKMEPLALAAIPAFRGNRRGSRYHQSMSDRVKFDTDCPNNHNQTISFTREEFEDGLKSGELVFHCNTCDTDWTPSREEIAKLRKEFAKEAE
jgi:hypothetical protein